LVQSVNFYTTAFVAEQCEKFEKAFKDQLVTSKVYANDSIAALDQFLENLKYSTEDESLDTRAKFIFINKTGHKVTICMDKFYISVNGKVIEKSTEFYSFLRSLIPGKQFIPQHNKIFKQFESN